MKESPFFKQADLLVQVMPFVNAEAWRVTWRWCLRPG